MSVEKTDNMVMRANLETIQGITGSNGLKSILNYAGLRDTLITFPLIMMKERYL